MKPWLWGALGAVLIGFLSFGYYTWARKPGFTGKDRSIAVLPFTDGTGELKNEYFNDGFTDEIIAELSKIRELKVVSRGSVMGYKGSTKSINAIADELGVAAVLKGEIRRSGNSIRINVQLTDSHTGHIIWEESYDRETKDIFFIQAEVAQSIAGLLHAELTGEEKEKIALRPTRNLEAFDQYEHGRYLFFKRTYESLKKAIEYFNRAILLDTAFSRAYSGLADCYSAQGYISYELPATAFLQAEAAAVRALQLDPTLAEPHTSLGYIRFYYYWDWPGAEKEFREAIQLDPGYALAYDSYGYYLTAMERYPEASVVMEKALQLDPLSAQLNTDMGFSLYYARSYSKAARFLKAALSISPRAPLAHLWLGRVYQEEKIYRDAIREYEQTLDGFRDWPVAYAAMGYVYGVSGQQDGAERMLAKLQDVAAFRYVTPYGMALVYEALHDREKTFEWLDKAFAERSNWLVWLKSDPRWVLIKDDMRFKALLSKIGLSARSPSSSPE